MRDILASGLFSLALCATAQAGPITVDGKVGDWGISVGDANTSNFASPAVPGAAFFAYAKEDQNDLAGDAGYLGPNHGGQNYDVEFMGVALSGTHLYISIVTGQRPDNGLARFSPGDIRIVANNGKIYGIEVGGGAGAAALAGLLHEGEVGSTYSLNSSGFTLAHAASPRTVGSIWENPNWLLDPIPPSTAVQMGTAEGTHVGTADFVFTRDADASTQHAVIELSIARSVFGDATALDIYWGPSCGNDVLLVHDDIPSARVPEPATLAALGIGLIGLALSRRRK